MPVYQTGLGETLGDSLVTTSNLYVGGTVLYVHHTGSDSYAGTSRQAPKATIGSAVTASASGSLIVCLDGHTETLTGAVTLSNASTVIVGAGQSSGKPTVKFTNNQAAAAAFVLSGTGCELRNIWLEEESQANSSTRITMSGLFTRLVGCYIESNGNSDAYDVTVSNSYVSIRNNTFISTATAASSLPVGCITGTSISHIEVDGNTFDGGSYGYSGYALRLVTAIAGLKGLDNSLLRDVDTTKPAVGADDGYIAFSTASGASQIEGW